jgi:hypothetical protein
MRNVSHAIVARISAGDPARSGIVCVGPPLSLTVLSNGSTPVISPFEPKPLLPLMF